VIFLCWTIFYICLKSGYHVFWDYREISAVWRDCIFNVLTWRVTFWNGRTLYRELDNLGGSEYFSDSCFVWRFLPVERCRFLPLIVCLNSTMFCIVLVSEVWTIFFWCFAWWMSDLQYLVTDRYLAISHKFPVQRHCWCGLQSRLLSLQLYSLVETIKESANYTSLR
jgi:hypothetical protein